MHEIDMSNGRSNMAYVGQKPWHGLGAELDPGESIDQWRIAAGLNWEAKKTPVLFNAGGLRISESRNVLYRDDTNAELGVVSDNYKIVQPADVLEFYRDLVESQGFELETAGSLRGGRRIWALARTGREFNIMGQDRMEAYQFLATGFDGLFATHASFTSVRVVCQNTLSLALGNGSGGVTVPHSSVFDAQSIKRDLGLDASWAEFEDTANTLAERKVSRKEAVSYFMTLVYGEGAEELDESDLKQGKRRMESLLSVYEGGVGQQTRSAAGTAWGLVNAVTRYTDHERNARSSDTRMNYAWFGKGARDKQDAVELALKLVA